ncbi:matrix metalloproteinase-24-like [Tachypleus tridentatus]|uniref:matrix metalloproteinase-24-like n=1 Tax=Tachypleus tridentatus TaxID=6853 RepID=UPI003FD07597
MKAKLGRSFQKLLFKNILFVLWNTMYVIAVPTANLPSKDMVDFMKQYGYFINAGPKTDALYTEESFREAVKQMQQFGHLPTTGFIDEATTKLLTAPRCGIPDLPRQSPKNNSSRAKRYVIGSEGWKKKTITYKIHNWPPQLEYDQVVEVMKTAFNTWSEPASPLRFEEVRNGDPDIEITFASVDHGDGYPFDGQGRVLAHAFFPYDFGSLGGDIHFDADEFWIDGSKGEHHDGIDLFSAAVHEIGHSLGLGHSAVENSVMFPYYQRYKPGFRLHYDDLLAMHELYIVRGSFEDEQYDKPGNSGSTTDTPLLPPKKDDSGSICNGYFDAVGLFKDDIVIFKGLFIWRFRDRGILRKGYPTYFNNVFRGLPSSMKHVDAVYQRTSDLRTLLFSGKHFWIFDGYTITSGSPRPLTYFGLPSYLTRVDAVLEWQKNGKTYFFSGNRYWKYDSKMGRMDEGYPQSIQRWQGVPMNIDAVFTWKSLTYFFKNDLYWRFNDNEMMVDKQFPFSASRDWVGCQ